MSAKSPMVQELLKGMALFHDLNPEELDWVMDSGELKTCKDNEILYEEGEDGADFFIIVSGQVILERSDKDDIVNSGFFTVGDFFGEESLYASKPIRRTSALTNQPCSLIHFDRNNLADLIEEIPSLKSRLQLALRSFELRCGIIFKWLNEDESILFITRPHPFFLFAKQILPLFALFVSFLLFSFMGLTTTSVIISSITGLAAIGWGVWNMIDWSNDFCIVTDQRLVFLEKVVLFYQNRHETPLDAVLSVGLKTSIWGRIFGYGDLNVRTFTGMVTFRRIPEPAITLQLVEQYWQRSKQIQSLGDQSQVEESIRSRLNPLPTNQEGEEFTLPNSNSTIESGEVPAFLERILKLREEVPGGVLYRTHWWILVRKTFPPALGSIILFGLVVLFYGGVLDFLSDGTFLIFIAIGVLAMFAWWIYALIDWRNDVYIITSDQLLDIYKKPLAEEERRAAPLKNIQTIEHRRIGLAGLLLNFGTVFIRVGDVEFTFDNVSNPSEVQRELFARFMALSQREKRANIESERQRMADWIEAYHKVVKETPQSENTDNDDTNLR